VVAVPEKDLQTALTLRTKLNAARPRLEELDCYYRGEQPLSYMHPELQKELADSIRQLVINWPQLVTDALEERLDIEGFRLNEQVDDRVWGWWQSNGLDLAAQQGHIDALVMGRAYAIIGTNPADEETPLITVESPQQVYTARDPATRRVTSAVKCWQDDDRVEHMTLYTPQQTVWMTNQGRDGWQLAASIDAHELGVTPVVALVNRGRTLNQDGVSELSAVIPLSDAANKIGTDMMVSADFNAIPRTIAYGVTEADFVDRDGNPVSKWEKIAGRIWALTGKPKEVEVTQLPAADLQNFHSTINALARLVASLAGMPPHYFGWSDSNPASADAIKSSETRLVKRAERRQRAFGEGWEQVMRVAFLIADGELPAGALRMETIWRDPATPTISQSADALGKFAESLGIPKRALWPKVPGVTTTEVARWERMAEEERTANALAQAASFGVIETPDPPVDAPAG
jgi:hypothetical protein